MVRLHTVTLFFFIVPQTFLRPCWLRIMSHMLVFPCLGALRRVKVSLLFSKFLGLIPVALQSYYRPKQKKTYFPKYSVVIFMIFRSLAELYALTRPHFNEQSVVAP